MAAAPGPWLNQRWTINLSILFTELPLLQRPAAAAAAGFDAAELSWPVRPLHRNLLALVPVGRRVTRSAISPQ